MVNPDFIWSLATLALGLSMIYFKEFFSKILVVTWGGKGWAWKNNLNNVYGKEKGEKIAYYFGLVVAIIGAIASIVFLFD